MYKVILLALFTSLPLFSSCRYFSFLPDVNAVKIGIVDLRAEATIPLNSICQEVWVRADGTICVDSFYSSFTYGTDTWLILSDFFTGGDLVSGAEKDPAAGVLGGVGRGVRCLTLEYQEIYLLSSLPWRLWYNSHKPLFTFSAQ